jgi:aspartate ammonia-lyase
MTITLTIDIDVDQIRRKRDLDAFMEKTGHLKRILAELRDLCNDDRLTERCARHGCQEIPDYRHRARKAEVAEEGWEQVRKVKAEGA